MPPWSSMYIDAPTSSGEEPSTSTSSPAATRRALTQPSRDGGGGVLDWTWSSVSLLGEPVYAARGPAEDVVLHVLAGSSASTPNHAFTRLEKSVQMLSTGKLEPNIARSEPNVVDDAPW